MAANLIEIRSITAADIPELLRLIQELADFENEPHGPQLTVDRATADFAEYSLFDCFIAVKTSETNSELHRAVGFILYYPIYKMTGRCIYMNGLYVSPEVRGTGLGTRLWSTLTEDWMTRNGIKQMFFTVFGWNQAAIDFYANRGATDLTQSAERHHCFCIDRAHLNILAKKYQNQGPNQVFKIRPMVRSDCGQIIKMINISDGSKMTADQLCQDGFPESAAARPLFYGWVAEDIQDSEDVSPQLVGYCLISLSYSIWRGLCACLSDIYVDQRLRRRGIGSALLSAAAHWSTRDCPCGQIYRLDLILKRNEDDNSFRPSSVQEAFFDKHGVKNLTLTNQWHSFVLNT